MPVRSSGFASRSARKLICALLNACGVDRCSSWSTKPELLLCLTKPRPKRSAPSMNRSAHSAGVVGSSTNSKTHAAMT